MANTGIKIVLTLKKVVNGGDHDGEALDENDDLCSVSGLPQAVKVNDVGDPDYIAPYENLDSCPIPSLTVYGNNRFDVSSTIDYTTDIGSGSTEMSTLPGSIVGGTGDDLIGIAINTTPSFTSLELERVTTTGTPVKINIMVPEVGTPEAHFLGGASEFTAISENNKYFCVGGSSGNVSILRFNLTTDRQIGYTIGGAPMPTLTPRKYSSSSYYTGATITYDNDEIVDQEVVTCWVDLTLNTIQIKRSTVPASSTLAVSPDTSISGNYFMTVILI